MSNEALTLKYTPKGSTREYNTFTEEYFSGADVTLYLDGEKMTQVTGLQYSIQEQLKPMYGYASRTFDDVAIGNRIVIGSFRVPVSNPEQNMKVEEPKVINLSNEFTTNDNPNMPSWTLNNTRYGDINYVNQGREYYDPSNTGQVNGSISGSTSSQSNSSQLRYSEETLEVQKRLVQLSYAVDVTGIYDLKTKRALQLFQEVCRINATGMIDEETKGYLFGDTDSSVTYGFITTSDVALRVGPGSTFNTITSKLPVHTKVQIIEIEGDWYKIKLEDNKKGFVAKTFVSVVK